MDDEVRNAYELAELQPERARYWLSLDCWTRDEAQFLLLALDPDMLAHHAKARGGRLDCGLPETLPNVVTLLARAEQSGALGFPCSPRAVIDWAVSKSLRLPQAFIPEELIADGGKWIPRARARFGVEGLSEEGANAAKAMVHFDVPACPSEVPPVLLELPEDVLVSFRSELLIECGEGVTRAGQLRDEIRRTIERQRDGHFTLNEAAQVLADGRPGLDPVEIVRRFRRAHLKGELPIHQGASRFPLEAGESIHDSWDTVEVGELDAWLRATAGFGFPNLRKAAAPLAIAESAPVRKNRLKFRAEPLTAVLAKARATALDPSDWESAWAALVALAKSQDRPAPLLGYIEGEGVKYQKDNANKPVDWLSRDAYRKRHKRSS